MNTLTKIPTMIDWFRNDFDQLFTSPLFHSTSMKSPVTNIIENEKEIKIEMSVPGFKRSELEIVVDNKILTVKGLKSSKAETSNDKYLTKEFAQESFSKSYSINSSLVDDSISSKLEDGILTLSIPKQKKVESKKLIEIK